MGAVVNIAIRRAFVRLREILAAHKDLARKLDAMEKRYDRQFKIGSNRSANSWSLRTYRPPSAGLDFYRAIRPPASHAEFSGPVKYWRYTPTERRIDSTLRREGCSGVAHGRALLDMIPISHRN